VNIRAAIASVETMLEYGLMRDFILPQILPQDTPQSQAKLVVGGQG